MVKTPDEGDATRYEINPRKHYNGTVPPKPFKTHYLNFGEEDQMEISGYVSNNLKKYATWTAYVFTLGILRLIFHWYPQWQLYATHTQSPLDEAEKVLIVDKYKDKFKSYFVRNIKILTSSTSGSETTKNENRTTDNIISIKGSIFSKIGENVLPAHLSDGTTKRSSSVRIVRCKKLTYVWDDDKCKFIKLAGLDKGKTTADFHNCRGYDREQQNLKRIVYGTNEINVPVQSVLTLLILEALTPFYIFQIFSLIVWFAEYYYYYTIAIVVMSVFGISTSIVQTRRNQKNLKGTVQSADTIRVSRGDGQVVEVQTSELVPGDVIVISPHGCDMQCDAVLLNGNCIVNESMLTGESVPVTKTPLPNSSKLYNIKEHTNHTLFCGTRVIQTRYYGEERVLAVVTRTGYLTTKGELVRSILYPPPADFKFDQDSYKFIMILAVIALLGFIYTVFSKYSRQIAPLDILIKALDLITIAIPPALPAAMTVGKLYALHRLKKKKIFCINSRVINVSGSVDCVCFDKTGTLTEDGLDMWGVVPVQDCRIQNPIKDVRSLTSDLLLFRGMLVCHSLTLIEEELCGDPLDIKMFESTGWQLEEPTISDFSKYDLLVPTVVKHNSLEIGLIQQYQFSSSLQRMTVICRQLESDVFEVFTKGSPEMIISLSRPETVPAEIWFQLKEYTEQGYRVIGMATKTITNVPFHKIPKLQREEVECDLEFVGLIVLENRLKPQTADVIKTLKNAGMKLVMLTGDNIQTGVSVARDCGIIQSGHAIIDVVTTRPTKFDVAQIRFHETASSTPTTKPEDIERLSDRKYHFVVSGGVWSDLNRYFPELIPKIVTRGVVFARMTGQQKQQVIEELQNLGYYVAMCGDGANDCGALKAANVGISLSDAESSVASAFTAKEPNISCATHVVREGRAALVTSFGVFKLMLCYSLTEFASAILLYAIDSNLTSLQFLFIDICLVLNFASSFGKTRAFKRLHNEPPMTSLLSFVPLASIILFMVAVVGAQIFAYYLIQSYAWFEPFVFDPEQPTKFSCYENYAVFCVSMFQYIIMAVVFSKGKPYRKSMYSNYIFTFCIVLMVAICCYITMDPATWVQDALELQVPPHSDARAAILIVALVNFVVCVLVEDWLVERVLRKLEPKLRRVDKSLFSHVERELREDRVWPNTHAPSVCFKEVTEKGGLVNNGFNTSMETTM